MADIYGATPIVGTPGGSVVNPPHPFDGSDPLIGYVADFLKNVINTYAQSVWSSVAPGPNVVATVRLHDPAQNSINEKDFPALYAFRDDDVSTQLQWDANDYRFMRTLLHVLWIPPTATQDKRRHRVAVLNVITKVADRAIALGLDPAWKLTGDPDPNAATMGSQICTWAGCSVIEMRSFKWTKITIPMLDGTPKQYDALAMDFDIEELLTQDITTSAPNTQLSAQLLSPDQGTGLGPFDLGDAIYR